MTISKLGVSTEKGDMMQAEVDARWNEECRKQAFIFLLNKTKDKTN